MIHGYLNERGRYKEFLRGDIWEEAFTALDALTPDTPLGIRELRGSKVFVNVHTYETLPEASCKWETHRHTIDLQYIITGSERIGMIGLSDLGVPTQYREEKDTVTYAPKAAESFLFLKAGGWAIFFPEDPHKPKIATERDSFVLKAVVKIDCSVFT